MELICPECNSIVSFGTATSVVCGDCETTCFAFRDPRNTSSILVGRSNVNEHADIPIDLLNRPPIDSAQHLFLIPFVVDGEEACVIANFNHVPKRGLAKASGALNRRVFHIRVSPDITEYVFDRVADS